MHSYGATIPGNQNEYLETNIPYDDDGHLCELKRDGTLKAVVVVSIRHVALITTFATETMIGHKQDQECPSSITAGKKQFTQSTDSSLYIKLSTYHPIILPLHVISHYMKVLPYYEPYHIIHSRCC